MVRHLAGIRTWNWIKDHINQCSGREMVTVTLAMGFPNSDTIKHKIRLTHTHILAFYLGNKVDSNAINSCIQSMQRVDFGQAVRILTSDRRPTGLG